MKRRYTQIETTHPSLTLESSVLGFVFLWIYLIAVLARPQEWNPESANLTIARYFLIIAFGGYLLLQREKHWPTQLTLLTGLTTVIFLSGVRNGWFSGGIYTARDFLITCVIPFVLFCGLSSTLPRIRILLATFVLTALLMVHHGYSQLSSPLGIGWSGASLSQGTRITYLGIFNDPNDLGLYLTICIPLVYYFYTSSKSLIVKLAMLSFFLFLLWGIAKTNSRGTLLGLLSLGFLYIFLRYGKIKATLATLVIIPIALTVLAQFRTIDPEEASASQRIEAWYAAVTMFKQRPALGTMKDSFMDYHHKTAHNSYALVMAELGAAGYVLWFSAIFYTQLKLMAVFGKRNNKVLLEIDHKQSRKAIEIQLIAKCLFFSLFGFSVTAFFLSRSYLIVLYILLGIAAAVIKLAEPGALSESEQRQQSAKLLGKTMIGAGISLLALYLVIRLLV